MDWFWNEIGSLISRVYTFPMAYDPLKYRYNPISELVVAFYKRSLNKDIVSFLGYDFIGLGFVFIMVWRCSKRLRTGTWEKSINIVKYLWIRKY